MRQPLKKQIKETQNKLQADDKQLARHLRLKLADFEAIASGARVLPLPAQKILERRMKGLLELCGLK